MRIEKNTELLATNRQRNLSKISEFGDLYQKLDKR